VNELENDKDTDILAVQKEVEVIETEGIPRVTGEHRLEYKTIRLDSYSTYNNQFFEDYNY